MGALTRDEPCLLDAAEREALLASWLPDVRPDPSRNYLLRLRDQARAQFLSRLSHLPALAHRLDRDMASPAELDDVVKTYLRASGDLSTLAGAGAEAPLDHWLARCAASTLVLAEPSVPVGRRPRGGRVEAARLPAEVPGRGWAIRHFVAAARRPRLYWSRSQRYRTVARDSSGDPCGCPDGHLHARVSLAVSGRPVVELRYPAGSDSLVLPSIEAMLGSRPLVALDLPGNGESDNTHGATEPGSAD